jgi:uncharacterized membrane protein YhaH (DUF805 family)
MSYINKCFINVIRNSFNFKGRATRKEYWMFQLFSLFFIFFLFVVLLPVAYEKSSYFDWIMLLLSGLYLLVSLANIALTIRRFHDLNKSGWWFLWSLLPYIGIFIIGFFMLQRGDINDNQYGESPYKSI